MTKTALLLSGGMDSYALAFMCRPDVAITIDYGQRPAEAEIRAATIITERLDINHEVIWLDLNNLGSGDLSTRPALEFAPASDWWPYRNQMLITMAAMHAVGQKVGQLMIATVKSDEIHKDGTAEFIRLMDQVMQAQEGGLRILAPAIGLSTVELVRTSKIPLSLLAWSHSCHTSNIACGQCRGCFKQRAVLEELDCAEIG